MAVGGSADRLIDAIGRNLAQAGAYVEKARCKPNADYSFVEEFDLVILARRFTICSSPRN